MQTYAVTIDNETHLIDAETASKARWQAVQHRLEWLDRRDRKHLFDGVSVRKAAGGPFPAAPTPAEMAAAWNAKHPIGTLVRYWRGLREGEPSGVGKVRHPAQAVSGTASVWIDGCSGCIALSHVEVVR